MPSIVLFGGALACSTPSQSASPAPFNLAEVLSTIDRASGTEEAMLHTTAARFLEFVNSTAELAPIDLLHSEKRAFVAHLKAGRYKLSSVKSYSNYLRILLRRAEDLGWKPDPVDICPEWRDVLTLLPQRPWAKQIVSFGSRCGKPPALFSEAELAEWRRERVNEGRSVTVAEGDCSRFRAAVARTSLASRFPLIKPRDKRYGVPLAAMHPSLREEVQAVMDWKRNEFEIDRPSGARIREISAKRLRDLFGQLVGFVENIEGQERVISVSGLITRSNIVKFASWATNKRKLKGQSLATGLGMVYAAVRYNPRYSELDLSWFANVIDQLPVEAQSTIDDRKAKKYIPYAAAEQIPEKIRAKAKKLKVVSARTRALSARNELLMLWLIVLPWRQRNIRELRIGGGKPNLVKAAVREYCTATKPLWIEKKSNLSSHQVFWQVRFAPEETKMKHSVQLFLPAELVPLLETYLSEHRPVLVAGKRDPGTLFISDSGGSLNVGQMRTLVKKLAFEHTGVPVTPHIYRDIVAVEWLLTHPEDYLTVSKVLWHRNVNTTIRIYGRRFDESTGVARMDNWRASRGRGSH